MSTNGNDRLFSSIAALRLELDAVAAGLDRAKTASPRDGGMATEIVELVATARHILASRTAIVEIFDSAQFVDPATNIMLRLFIDANGDQVTTSGACCTAAGVPRTTALRLIALLQGRDLIDTYELPGDRRTTLLRLTPSGHEKIRAWLDYVHGLFR